MIVLSFDEKLNKYELSQIPDVNGGMIVIDNFTGRVLAMVGGMTQALFNRAIKLNVS